MTKPNTEQSEIIEKLSPMERKVIPFLNLSIDDIKDKSGLDETSVLRALKFLESKGIVKVETESKKVVDLGTNGIYYKKNHLPERTLLMVLEQNNYIPLEEAQKTSKLSENEFKVSLGVLKSKALINLANGKISLTASKEELTKKSFEEQLLEILPKEYDSLPPQLLHAVENLKKRKEIIEIKDKKNISFTLTNIGKSLAGQKINLELIEEVTPEVIRSWTKGKKFRKYDVQAPVPRIYGGKKHFVNQSIEHAKRIWLDLGFQEMQGPLVDTSFWVFDSLFTPQDHPAREMQDTFFIKNVQGKLPSPVVIKKIKDSHEGKVAGSKGWDYLWSEKEAQKVLLRTHTTSVSVRTLSELKKFPAKYFTIGKVFRNETLDWSHLFEFYQTEGIVIDKNVNFRHLLGYLREFYKKMGYEKIKFVPTFFAYTEPSVEIQVFHPEKKIWFELGGAGMFRPEVTEPLLGKDVKVLAWGQGFERIITQYYDIKNLREIYTNDLKDLRNKKHWI